MPYYHCRTCHHEFEYIPIANEKIICDWCGTDKPIILEEKTPLEKMTENTEELLQWMIKKGEP